MPAQFDLLLSKLLPLFAYPLGLSLLFSVFIAWLAWQRDQRSISYLLLLMNLVLWICSTERLAFWLTHSLEQHFVPLPIAEYPTADAIVLLGGMASGKKPDTSDINLSDAIDRLLYAKRLFQAQRAPFILITGGSANDQVSEAQLLRRLLIEFGVPDHAILIEAASRNTRQNALGTKAVMAEQNWQRILLVTSATHMQRAVASFRTVGIDLIPAPTDFQVSSDEMPVLSWLPSAEALAKTTKMIKEYIGMFAYQWRGWIHQNL